MEETKVATKVCLIKDKQPYVVEETDELVYDKLIPGTPIYLKDNEVINGINNKLIGIIYNCDNNKIMSIPSISIIKLVQRDNILNNIFINYIVNDIKAEYPITVIQNHNEKDKTINKLEVGDQIYSINDKKINKDGYIFFSEINMYVSLNTYLWYSTILENIVIICRDNKIIRLLIEREVLNEKILLMVEEDTKYKIINNKIFCVLNLMMIEWLTTNDITLRNTVYLQFMREPYLKSKCNYLFVGLVDIDEHPLMIRTLLKPYNINNKNGKEMEYLDLFTIININGYSTILTKTTNIDKYRSIDKLTICDSNNKKLLLSWIN